MSRSSTSRARSRARHVACGAIVLAVAAGLGASGGCGNPAVDDKIATLGGEQQGVPKGPYHRPGQPCVLCHSKYYGAKPEMSVGGTVFADLKQFLSVENVDVVLTDAVGDTRTATTNCIGNFFITKDSWDPQFPIAAEIRYPVYEADGTVKKDDQQQIVRKVKAMGSWINRDGSCASCHTLYGRVPAVDQSGAPIWYDSTGWIYCAGPDETATFPALAPTCPGKEPHDASQTSATSTGSAGGGG
jgi:hypothetical protein